MQNYLQHLASIQPRTSPVKFARSLRTDPYYRSSRSSGESTNPCNRSLPTRADSSSHEAYDFAEDGDIGGDLSLGLPVFFVPVFRVPIYWYVIFPYRYFPHVHPISQNSPHLLEMFWNVLQDTLTCGYYLKFPLRIGFENIDVKLETLELKIEKS